MKQVRGIIKASRDLKGVKGIKFSSEILNFLFAFSLMLWLWFTCALSMLLVVFV